MSEAPDPAARVGLVDHPDGEDRVRIPATQLRTNRSDEIGQVGTVIGGIAILVEKEMFLSKAEQEETEKGLELSK